MGRNRKIGLDYFPFDVDFFDDIKIRKLIKYQGCKSIAIYTLLLCNIYKSGYYMRWDEELPFIISEKTGYEEAYIREVIRCCLSVGLFSKELYDSERILTSKGVQERYEQICVLSRRVVTISAFSLISSEQMPISSEQTPINSEKSAQREEKQSKENIFPNGNSDVPQCDTLCATQYFDADFQEKQKRKKVAPKKERGFDLSFVPVQWRKIMEDWLEYRRGLKRPYKTQQGVEQFYNQLVTLSDNDGVVARKIINRTISNEWRSIGEHCKEETNHDRKTGTNSKGCNSITDQELANAIAQGAQRGYLLRRERKE